MLRPQPDRTGSRPGIRGVRHGAGRSRGNRYLSFLVVAVSLAGCGSPDTLPPAAAEGRDGWAPPPAPVSLAATAPDDPSAYRGLRFKIASGPMSGMLVNGQLVPWLALRSSGYSIVVPVGDDQKDNLYYGETVVHDGRREMHWFTRVVGPIPEPPVPPDQPGPGYQPGDPPVQQTQYVASPEQAVLDVLVYPAAPSGAGFGGCGGVPEVMVLRNDDDERVLAAWRFERSTGRIRELEPDRISCRPTED